MQIIALSLFIVILDQSIKFTITKSLAHGRSLPLIKNFFHLTLVHNSGAAFGIMKNQTHLFVALSAAAILSIIYYLPRCDEKSRLNKIALALILGGAAGNLCDRIRFGYVIDFLDFRIWPVFNLADSAITVGAALLIIEVLKKSQK